MGNHTESKATAVQHLFMVKAKLLATHAALQRFGRATNEDPLALGRVEMAMQYVDLALEALSAEREASDEGQEDLPF